MTEIRSIETVANASALASFFQSIWSGGPEVVPTDLIVAGAHVGAYAAGAYQGSKLIGGSFGIMGRYNGKAILHSHVTAATQAGVGFELKQHQRNWAEKHQLEAITWTFDPLVRRNSYFNFTKLGAVALEYLPNFYGSMPDEINAGEESDRLFAYWSIGGTKLGSEIVAEIELPEDIEAMRKTDPALATQLRLELRAKLIPLFAAGAVISKMSEDRSKLVVTK